MPKVPVIRPESLGDKHLNELPKEFRARVAECFLGLWIRQSDPAFLVHHDHCAGGRFDHPAEALFPELQLPVEMRNSSHIATQLIAHRRHDPRICEAEEKGDVNGAPDHQRDVPRQDRAEDHATADEHCASPITPPPDGNCGIYRKDKQQEQANLAK